jgi:hypothetical protein
MKVVSLHDASLGFTIAIFLAIGGTQVCNDILPWMVTLENALFPQPNRIMIPLDSSG